MRKEHVSRNQVSLQHTMEFSSSAKVTWCSRGKQCEGGGRGLRISVGNLKLPDSQSRKPETSGENRAATNQNPRAIFFLVCRCARSLGLAARQSTPALDAAIYYPNSTSYQLQPSFHTQSTEPEPTARAPSKCPIDLFGPVSNRTILKRLHGLYS